MNFSQLLERHIQTLLLVVIVAVLAVGIYTFQRVDTSIVTVDNKVQDSCQRVAKLEKIVRKLQTLLEDHMDVENE